MRTIRLKLNTKQCYKCLATDSITGKQPVTWRANATNIDVGVFTDDTPIDLTGFTNLELVIRPDRVTADNVAYNLVATPDSDTITLVGWDAGTDQHVTFSLADNELNLDLDGKESKSYWLAITGTDASGNETTFGTSWLTVEEDNNATADPPPEYPGAGIGENIIDAKGDLIVGLADNTPDRIAVGTNGQILIADSAEALGVKWGTASGTGDLLASNNLSDVANAATSLSNLGGLASTDIDTLAELNAIVTDATIGDASDFATAAQGTTADTASQPGHTHVASTDMVATGTPDATSFLRGDDTWSTPSGSGDVVGPASAVDSNFAAFDTTTGKLIKDSTFASADFATAAQGTDARTPTAHAASHTDGTDDIQDATNAVKGLATAAQITALEANTAASHAAATSSGTGTYVTLTGQDIVVDPIDITDITDNVALSTGVLTGGVLSTGAGAAEYSISDGTGIIVDETGAITEVSWTGKSNITPTNIATNLLTWVSIDNAGNVVEMTSPCTPAGRRAEICLGVIVHVNLTTVDAVNNEQVVAFNAGSTVYDLADALGFINVSGNVFSANGANLNLNKSVGEIFATGSNYDTAAATNPHIKTLAVLSALTFQYRYSDGSSGATGTAITPSVLDDGAGGTLAVTNNRWSVQRIYSFVSNNVKIQLGVEEFTTKDNAIAGIASEAYITEQSIADNGLLRGWLVVKEGATDLSDSTQAQFIEAGKLGEVGSAGGGGAGNVVAELGIAVSDETTALTTGTAKGTFRMPYAMTVTDVRATVTTAPTGANIIVDINDGGTSIMTTNKLSIDATEKTSTTAATAPVVTDTALSDDAEITIDIDQIGSTIAGAGLKIWIIGTRA